MSNFNRDPMVSRRLVSAVFLVLVGLLVAVIVVGLVRNQINVDGLIIALMPVVTGVILGSMRRGKDD